MGVWVFGGVGVFQYSTTPPLRYSALSRSRVLSALKKADQADRIVARVFNIGTTEASGKVSIEGAGNLVEADLNEEVLGEPETTIGPKKIVTVVEAK